MAANLVGEKLRVCWANYLVSFQRVRLLPSPYRPVVLPKDKKVAVLGKILLFKPVWKGDFLKTQIFISEFLLSLNFSSASINVTLT